MIPIEKYGIRLLPLEKQDLEMVRSWRNLPHVRKNFEFQEDIDSTSQLAWFEQLNSQENWYWVIEVGEERIGVVHIKEIDSRTKTGEAGVFIGNERFLNSPEPVYAVLAMMDFAFVEKGFESLKAKIHRERREIIAFNLALGYRKAIENSEKSKFGYYECTKDAYLVGKMRKSVEPKEK